jgi:hypothetical protein
MPLHGMSLCPAKVYVAIHAKTLVLFKTPIIATGDEFMSLLSQDRRAEDCLVFANIWNVSNIREVIKTRDANERVAGTHSRTF